jgi:hypothetical protein
MKIKFIASLLMLVIFMPLFSQNKVTDCVTSGNETYSIINISRSFTFQEKDTWSKDSKYMVLINDTAICEISCRSRVSIKVYSEGNLKLTLKFLVDKYHPQKVLDKHYKLGLPLEINTINGNTYYINVALSWNKFTSNLVYRLIKIPESEGMFKEEKRFEENPEIYLYEYRL